MNEYGDIAIYVERLIDGGWVRSDDVHFLDRGGALFRRLQQVGGLEVLRRVDDVAKVALTLGELAAAWDDERSGDGFIPFRSHSSWDPEPYVEWRKSSPRRSPHTYHAGAPAGAIVDARQAEAALAGRSDEEAERVLRETAEDVSGERV
jgi:hypothetical protein